jgi:hypothetical protein
MAFTVTDFHDLVELLEQQPQWRHELRRLVLTDELLGLPRAVSELTAAQQRTESSVAELVEAHKRTDAQVAELVETQRSTSLALAGLADVVKSLTRDVHDKLLPDVGWLKGLTLERDFRDRPLTYYRKIVRRAHTLSERELSQVLEGAVERGQLTYDDVDDIVQADAVVEGRSLRDGTPVYLVVEVSWGIGKKDVQRAARRSALLTRAGTRAEPVVGGKWFTPDAQREAEALSGVHLVEWQGELPDLRS